LLPLQHGEIYIDGKSYKKNTQSALKISYVSQLKTTSFTLAGNPAVKALAF
jgi:zinc transport system ATP-binding protein